MKNIQTHSPGYKSAYFRFFFFPLCALCVLCVSISAQDFRTVRDGIEYAEVTREISGQQVRMNLLRLDLTKVRLDVVHAMDAAIGTEKTSSIATRHGAFAAINAGFFRLDNSIFAGDPAGVLKIDGKVLSESNSNRIALFLENKPNETVTFLSHLNIGGTLLIGKRRFFNFGLNRQRTEDDLVIFTPEFGRTTLTDPNGLEVIIRRGKITQIRNGKGSSPIPADGFVISATGRKRVEVLRRVKIGVISREQFSSWGFGEGLSDNPINQLPPFSTSEDIVGGVPELVRNGKIHLTWEQEKSSKSFVETRHPRTAVAKLKDGKFLMITVDGRSESSGGIGLYDLSNYLLELGASDAMNLDGGGSTTMFLDGKVVNHPSDKEGERKVSDAILVFPRGKIH